jgi:hypothetical protein
MVSFKNNKRSGYRAGSSSKAGDRSPEDASVSRTEEQYHDHASANARSTADSNSLITSQDRIIFKRNMEERTVRINLFMIEGETGFEKCSLREKMTKTALHGDARFRDWYFERGIENELPSEWEEFKRMVLEFCTGIGF